MDRRVLRSRKRMQETIVELLETERFEKLTVARLAEAADITRPTFYQHYDSLEALLGAAIDAVFEEPIVTIPDEKLRLPLSENGATEHVFEIWDENVDFAQVILKSCPPHVLLSRMTDYALRVYTRVLEINDATPRSEEETEYFAGILAGAIYGLFSTWAARGFSDSGETLTAHFQRMLGPGLDSLF